MKIIKPKGKCFAKKCNDCNWFRQREFERVENGNPIGIHEMRWCCEFETLLNAMHYHMGSLDGLQNAVNQAHNRTMETQAVLKHIVDSGGVVQKVELIEE